MTGVSIVSCEKYESTTVRTAIIEAIDSIGGFSFLREGMTVAIKTNLVAAMKPEKAAVTHPAIIAELVRLLYERGASSVVVGDSPGGLFTQAILSNSYRVCGYGAVEQAGGKLNHNTEQRKVDNPDGMVLKSFDYTSWLDCADVVIDVCKLKSHGMMGMSGAAKNLFGVVPGLIKTEMHFRFPDHDDFARMIIDLDDYVKPVLSLCDAVVGMEGNGPTGGTPRKIGCILASASPHELDLAAAKILGLTADFIPTLKAAQERGYIPQTAEELKIYGDINKFVLSDFNNVATKEHRSFSPKNHRGLKRVAWTLAGKLLVSRPNVIKKDCLGCGKCHELCPAHAIKIEKGKAHINKNDCIRCFCCQEFCPKSAIKVKKTILSKLLNR